MHCTSNNPSGAFASPLKWSVAGNRWWYSTLVNVGTGGYIWSSSKTTTSSFYLGITSPNAYTSHHYRGDAYSVRCIKGDGDIIYHNLQYNAGVGGDIHGPTFQTVANGEDGDNVSVLSLIGYKFTGWSDGVFTAFRTDTNVTSDINVTANFALQQDYTLTYSSTIGGGVQGDLSQTVYEGGSGTEVTVMSQTGYDFVGWSDGVSTASRTDTNVTSDISVTANFASQQQDYTLTYDAVTYNGSSYGVGVITGTNPQTVIHGGDGTEVIAEPGEWTSDYVFDCWSDGYAIQTVDGTPASRKDIYVTSDIDVTAYFTLTGASSPPACGGDDGSGGGGGGGDIDGPIVPRDPLELETL